MANTHVVVEDDSEDVPVIHSLGIVNKTTVSDNESDLFAKDAQELSSVRGLSPAFKRKATIEMKKFRRGADGTESKQINEKEFLTGYDTFGVVEPPYNLEYLTKLYGISSPHYAAVNAKVSNIVGLGYKLVETPKAKRVLERVSNDQTKLKNARRKLDTHKEELRETLENLNEEDTFTEIMVKVWRDYEVTGNGYLEIGRKKDGTIGYIGHVPSKTMRIRRDRDGFVQMNGFEAQFFAHFGAGIDDNGNPVNVTNPLGGGKPNEMIHLSKYSPVSDYYGVPDIMAATNAVAGDEFAARFNLDYFENKAVPRYVVILKGATLSQNAQSQLLSFFETSLKGQNHRSLYVPLPADTDNNKVSLDFEAIEAGTQDSSFNNYRKANLSQILMVHRVPISKVSVAEGMNLALAKDADKTFKEQVCAPEQDMWEKKLNKIMKEFTDAFKIDLNEMTLTDAETQSKIDERAVKNGWMLPNEVRARDGLPGIPGGDKRVDLNAKATPASAAARDGQANRERDSARSAGATDSSGNARNPKGEGRSVQ